MLHLWKISVFETETDLFEPWERKLTEPSAFPAADSDRAADAAPLQAESGELFEVAALAADILMKTAHMSADLVGGIREHTGRALTFALERAAEDITAAQVREARAALRACGRVAREVDISTEISPEISAEISARGGA